MSSKVKMPIYGSICVVLGSLHQFGLHPLQEKVKAVKEAPNPSELKSYLGLLTYYSKFLPDVLAPLYKLLRKDVQWQWTDTGNGLKAFQVSKELLHDF